MIDKSKIPEPLYEELIAKYGKEEAERIIIEENYNFRAISVRLMGNNINETFQINRLYNYLSKKTGLKVPVVRILTLAIVLISIYLIYKLLFEY